MKSVKNLLTLSLLTLSTHAALAYPPLNTPPALANAPMVNLVCTFSGGITLTDTDTGATPDKHSSHKKVQRFMFEIPSVWKTLYEDDINGIVRTTATNLDGVWKLTIVAMLHGHMLRLLEATSSDNAFYVHVWFDKINPNNTFEALYVFTGARDHSEDSTLQRGSCRFIS